MGLIMTTSQENSLPLVEKNGNIQAAVLAAFSVASVALPIVNVKVMFGGAGVSLASPFLLGGIAFLLPLAFLAGLAARFAPQAQPHIRTLEIVGLVIAIGIAVYAALMLFNGMNEMGRANQQMTQMLGAVNAQRLSAIGGVSLAPGGCIALFLLLAGSGWQVWSGRRRADFGRIPTLAVQDRNSEGH